jgi:hypothetical protein
LAAPIFAQGFRASVTRQASEQRGVFGVGKPVKWQIRADFHNALNHPWFGSRHRTM